MKIRKPDYYDQFRCIAGACKDSCCIGWEIDVDEERREIYRNADGILGEKLRTCIDWEDGHFILQGTEERCPFLNEENLCELIIGLGEDSLCDICREHPRYYDWYEGVTEVGVGLCCEAAARLILENDKKATFVTCEDLDAAEPEDEPDEETIDIQNVLFGARETAFAILQDRSKSIWERIRVLRCYIDEIQEALDFGNLDEAEESANYYRTLDWETETEREVDRAAGYRELIKICRRLEAIDDSWPKRLDALDRLLADSLRFDHLEQEVQERYADRDFEYEHLAVYFIYRYFMKCRTEGDVYSQGCLTVFCLLLIRLLDIYGYSCTGELTKEDRAQNAKNVSKEIEYSEENLNLLSEIFWKEGFEYEF